MQDTIKTYKIFIFIIYVILLVICPFNIRSQEIDENVYKYLLTESEMPGYEIIKSEPSSWYGLEKEFIWQEWDVEGTDGRRDFFFIVGVFDSIWEAINKVEYNIGPRAHEFIYIWGSPNGSIPGDESWFMIGFPHEESTIFVRGNVVVLINKRVNEIPHNITVETLTSKMLRKVEQNLDSEILSIEQTARVKQISSEKYQQITDETVNSDKMTGYSVFSEWDSKWLIDENSFAMGKRKEWKNYNGALIGIDICEFESDDAARSAVEFHTHTIRFRHSFTPFFDIDDFSTLDSLIVNWQWIDYNIITGICKKGKTAMQVYHYNPEGINTEDFKSIAIQLANRLSFIETSVIEDKDNAAEIPQVFELFQNRPNPFNPVTTIRYVLYGTEQVNLKVYDVLGHEVATLVDSIQGAGSHEIIWQGTNKVGRQVSSGIYFYCLCAGEQKEAKSMMLVR